MKKKRNTQNTSENSDNKVSVGLIGPGRMGQIHIENLARHVPHARLIAVAAGSLSEAKTYAQKYTVPRAVDDYRTLLEDKQIEAVVINTPSEMHARMIEEAARAGKHIFCEKPIGLTLEEIDEALSSVKKAGVKLQIGFNRRFDPNFRKIQKDIAAGHIGTPHLIRITNRDPAPPSIEYVRGSGGLFFDFTMHDFDMVRFLLKSEVIKIYAMGAVRIDPRIGRAGDIDTTIITLQFADGTLGTIDNSRKAVYGYDQRAEIFGSQGMISTENNTPTRTILHNNEGSHSPVLIRNFPERYRTAYIEEMQAFIESIQNNTLPLVTGEDGRRAVVLALAAQQSYDEQRPIDIPMD